MIDPQDHTRWPREMLRRLALTVALAVAVPSGCAAQSTMAATQAFVSAFYSEYTTRTLDFPSTPVWASMAGQPDSPFTPDLAMALLEDFDASKASPGVIVGLDFDPFLASQDPCDSYAVGPVLSDAVGYRAEIHGDCTSEAPDVIAQIIWLDGTPRISNVLYPRFSTDLSAVLQRLRDARERF